jgi:hypothetical protein
MQNIVTDVASKIDKVLKFDGMYDRVSVEELVEADSIDPYKDWLIAVVEECEKAKDNLYDDAVPAFNDLVAK